ncbi:acetyl-CoA C-acetyltransferase [Pyrinomonas methylaliphatogenes]|uniref:Acetyl-CoA acetyltransferase n=1 Tax=Pyrinomonas methylaliphatogenes TaxID=454194 RepID=A0A0B6X118_9BACT|nr:acetyl-CoA C-acetyltransferase [Pyrinomonas methylaliphatogenes]CDM66075.1 acetyl-CoA acetyltransferase [Pyrinomonas methylaliphatogenes]
MLEGNEAVIISAVRTPTGKFLGALKDFSATDLGAMVVREAVRRAGVKPEDIDEVIMGCVIQAGLGQNPARQAALKGGLPHTVSAFTVNKVCGSGLKAVMLAAQSIRSGDAAVIVAGGMESMSNAPYLLPKAREGYRMGHGTLIDAMIHDGLWCAFENYHMGNTGEVVAELYRISRQEQDEYALNSHRKAVAAIRAGKFKDEILPIEIPQKKGAPIIFDTDEPVREDTSLEALAKLKPAFKEGGTVTAGNAPGVNDGASALVVTSFERARALGVEPMARIVAYASSGVEPKMVMMAPVEAIRRVLQKAGWALSEVDLFEINEAFSVQLVAIMRELGLDPKRVNVNGGAVALGHAIGNSGARVLTTLLYEMRRSGARRGIAALCLGGGNAVAMAVER